MTAAEASRVTTASPAIRSELQDIVPCEMLVVFVKRELVRVPKKETKAETRIYIYTYTYL